MVRKPSNRPKRVGLRGLLIALAAVCVPVAAGAVVTDVQGGPILSTKILRNPDPISTNSTVFVDVPGATTNLKTKQADTLVVARFFAESQCNGGNPGSWCSLRIVAERNGVETELRPEAGQNYAFDSVETGGDGYWSGSAMERSVVLKDKGKHTIKLQRSTTSASTTFRLDDSSLSIETSASTE